MTGRVLAASVNADRDSPAADVSAMDGYAVRLSDLAAKGPIPVCGQSAPGAPPPELGDGAAVQVFTGAMVPTGAEVVIKREDTEESDGSVRFLPSALSASMGEHIRRAGENAKVGGPVLAAGTRVTAAQHATMANFGTTHADLFAAVRVALITTGDEVGAVDQSAPKPWEIRNSNRESLTALWENDASVNLVSTDHCIDDRERLQQTVERRLGECDAVLLTGGVSMGDFDYVPDVIRAAGADIVFHGIPQRPGKPMLGAATDGGKLVLGLPGNPVSATVGGRRMAMPLLSKMSGNLKWYPVPTLVRIRQAGPRSIPLYWFRLVRMVESGFAEIVPTQGSGDLVSLGQSDGFVEVPPGASGEGPWAYYRWP